MCVSPPEQIIAKLESKSDDKILRIMATASGLSNKTKPPRAMPCHAMPCHARTYSTRRERKPKSSPDSEIQTKPNPTSQPEQKQKPGKRNRTQKPKPETERKTDPNTETMLGNLDQTEPRTEQKPRSGIKIRHRNQNQN